MQCDHLDDSWARLSDVHLNGDVSHRILYSVFSEGSLSQTLEVLFNGRRFGTADFTLIELFRLSAQIIEYAGSGATYQDVGFAQAAQPLSPSAHYFELEILEPGESCFIAIGVAHKQYPMKRHPGWSKGSIAYHADDGEIFIGA